MDFTLHLFRVTLDFESTLGKITVLFENYHNLCASRFRDSTDLTSDTNLRASKTGNKLSRAVSVGSLNHDLIGIALSEITKVSHETQKNISKYFTTHLDMTCRRLENYPEWIPMRDLNKWHLDPLCRIQSPKCNVDDNIASWGVLCHCQACLQRRYHRSP